jgi:integrase
LWSDLAAQVEPELVPSAAVQEPLAHGCVRHSIRDDWEEWGELLAEAGVRYVRVHDGRHTAGLLMVEQGLHVRTIQQILGHTDMRTTQGCVHIAAPVVRDAAPRMGGVLRG